MTEEQIILKARMFKARGLSHKAIAERIAELYNVHKSVHTIKSWCLLRRRAEVVESAL